MEKDGSIVSYTVEELEEMRARGESRTDWARVDAMSEEELEAAIASDPDWADLPRDWYKHARPHYPDALRKEVRLRLDPDLLAWFKRQGPGYQARINAALRAFVEAHERKRDHSTKAAGRGHSIKSFRLRAARAVSTPTSSEASSRWRFVVGAAALPERGAASEIPCHERHAAAPDGPHAAAPLVGGWRRSEAGSKQGQCRGGQLIDGIPRGRL